MSVKRIVASLPASQFLALEGACRRLGLKRSRAVQEALSLWLSVREGDERVTRYRLGCVEQPEDAAEGRAIVRAWAQGIPGDSW